MTRSSPVTMDAIQIADFIERSPHAFNYLSEREQKIIAAALRASQLATPTGGEIMEATAAQHVGRPKGEPAQFVRNGKLETCQCRDCRDLTAARSSAGSDAAALDALARLIAPSFASDALDDQGNWRNHYVKSQAYDAAGRIHLAQASGRPTEITKEMALAGRKALARVADRMEEAKLLATSSIDFWQRVGHEPANEIYAAMVEASPISSTEGK